MEWLWNLSPHQLDVIRTIAVVIGSGCVPVFGFLLTRLGRPIYRWAREAAEQTRREERIDGQLYTVSVADDAHRMTHEITDLANEPARLHGRRRNTPTNPITLGESQYVGLGPDRRYPESREKGVD